MSNRVRSRSPFVVALVLGTLLGLVIPAGAATDTEVTVGGTDPSAAFPFSRNKQNEPAVSVNPSQPNLVVAGANDNVDMEDCNSGSDSTCPFTFGVGATGIQYSTDGGSSWNQPTFTGFSARNCTGVNDPPGATPTDTCEPEDQGPIGTLPKYQENNLISDGDPAMAWGPTPDGNGDFSWSNGSRLYFANLTSSFSSKHREAGFKGVEAIGVSRVDIPAGSTPAQQSARISTESEWFPPSLIPPLSGRGFADKEQVWADNAASSPQFGNAYVCFGNFVAGSGGAAAVRLMLARSTDGGSSWTQTELQHNTNSSTGKFVLISGSSGCTIRTASDGTVYVFWLGFHKETKETFIFFARSVNGGASFGAPRRVFKVVTPGLVDPVLGRSVMDGIAGARADLAVAPSIDIANGSATGAGATNRIVMTWIDGRQLNNEHVLFSYTDNGGTNWSTPRKVENQIGLSGDRGFYTAPAISPDGRDVWIVYNAFIERYKETTVGPNADRPLLGVVAHADASAGSVGPFSQVHRSPPGDARGSSQNDLQGEFLGDYVYGSARNDFGVFVWNDVRQTDNCSEIDRYRLSLREDTKKNQLPAPEPNNECAVSWGNSDIWGARIADPTPE